jgi:hypothetical protein
LQKRKAKAKKQAATQLALHERDDPVKKQIWITKAGRTSVDR